VLCNLGAESIIEVNVLMNFPARELNLLSQGIALGSKVRRAGGLDGGKP
jgi:hypothetical protein